MTNDIRSLLGLIKINGVGGVLARTLIQKYGTAKQALAEIPKSNHAEIAGVSERVHAAICAGPNWVEIDRELAFIEKNDIQCLPFYDDRYPRRLNFCNDAPALLFAKGQVDLNHPRILAVVGTRKATTQGKKMVAEIIEGLSDQNVLIMSGLAFGIDIAAHQAALAQNQPTVGALAHGLDRIYPREHQSTAQKMMLHGGVVTEFFSGMRPDGPNFPKRNRIIAGMADAILVVESQLTGGSMITADLGFSYGRDVMAIPGRPSDSQSKGCNFLIRTNKATLIESAGEIKHLLNWRTQKKTAPIQKSLFVNLSKQEEEVLAILKEHQKLPLDQLCLHAKVSMSEIAVSLLNLEMNGLAKSLPGKIIELG